MAANRVAARAIESYYRNHGHLHADVVIEKGESLEDWTSPRIVGAPIRA
jgi:hypothetical protein